MTPVEIRRPDIPFFVDLEITTACQLKCDYCARTFLEIPSQHMPIDKLKLLLDTLPHLAAVNLVGLGEPLLHPEIELILKLLKARGTAVSLVTNGLALDPARADLLLEAGLDAITFSLDSIEPNVVQRHREGTDIKEISRNIIQFMQKKRHKSPHVQVNIFCVLQSSTLSGLSNLARFAAEANIPAIVVSDLNFTYNKKRSLQSDKNNDLLQKQFYDMMRKVAGTGVVLLDPSILDKVQPQLDWPLARITSPSKFLKRENSTRQNCMAPWRTLVIRVDGTVNFCNCTPELSAGKIGQRDIYEIWWQNEFQTFRKNLYHSPVPESCRMCPRL